MSRRPQPWYRKARGSWFVTLDGNQINLGPDEKKAFEQYYELMLEPERETVPLETFAALADRFFDWVKRKRAPDTFEWYRYRLERFVQKHPQMLARDMRPHHVEAWVDEYDFSVTSRRNYMRTVKRCLSWAVKQGLLDFNPVASLEIPAAEHREIAFSAAEVDRLLSYIRNPALADLVITTWESGCRPQESLRIEPRHIDPVHHRWIIPKRESKTKRMIRVVYLNDRAWEITKRRMAEFPEGPIFRNTNGKPWTTEAVNCAFQSIRHRIGMEEMKRREETIADDAIAKKIKTLSPTRKSKGKVIAKTAAELRAEAKRKLTYRRARELSPQYSLYALRHSWATQALLKGVDPLTVAILMGHEDPSMLSKVYQHLSLNPAHMLAEAERATANVASVASPATGTPPPRSPAPDAATPDAAH